MDKERKVKIRKKLYFTIIIMLIIIALLIPFVFASVPMTEPTVEAKQFFSVDSLTKVPGSTLEMSINLDYIQYEDFIFNLSLVNEKELSDVNISDVTSDISEENDDEEVDMKYDKNEGSIVISGNKTKMNMSEIKLYYNIPEDAKIGTTITFKAEIRQNQEEIQNENDVQINESSNEVLNENAGNDGLDDINSINDQVSNEELSKEEVNQEETIEVTITIVEEENNKEEQGTLGENNQSSNKDQNQQGQNVSQSQNQNNNQFTSIQTNSTSSIKNVNSVQTETVTYKGSNNNYLELLQLEGYTLNKEFSKENTTYFVKIEDEVSSIEVTAEAEDEDAIVCVYGNEDIKEGSKILISVTAENGNVRTYRIFVTK